MAASKQLSPKKTRAIVALLSSGTVRDAAKEAGVPESTLRRWRREDADFRFELEARRCEALEDAAAMLHDATAAAVKVLVEQMEGADSESVKVRAATNLLRLGLLAQNQLDTERRLSEIEEMLKEVMAGGDP